MVGEACESAPLFLALEFFCVCAGFVVEGLNGIVCSTEEEKLARIVEIDRGVVSCRWCFEQTSGAEGVLILPSALR